MARSAYFQQPSRQRPDPIRIVAISGAIAANLALFAFLMQPPSFAPPIEQADRHIPTFITPLPKQPDPPPINQVIKRHDQPNPHTTLAKVQPPPQPPVIKDDTGPMDLVVPVIPPGTGSGKIDIQPGPVEIGLSPIVSPAPTYPRDALRDGITGTVELELVVGKDGRVIEARLVHSSGDHRLDAAAREQVMRYWRFQPAMRDGVAVESLGRLPIVFTLDGQ